jgi:hypothetical protein
MTACRHSVIRIVRRIGNAASTLNSNAAWHEMASFLASDATVLTLIESDPSLESFVSGRSVSITDVEFNDRRVIVQQIADLLDARISQFAEKYEDYDLIVDSIGKWLVVGTALWHPMFLCREYVVAITNAIASANAQDSDVVTNHFEFYGDATDWDFDFTELKFDFAVTSDTIAVSGITVGKFLELFDRTGTF